MGASGGKIKNKYGVERLTTRSLRRVSREKPCAAPHRPPSSVPPAGDPLLLSSKRQVVDLVHKEGGGGVK